MEPLKCFSGLKLAKTRGQFGEKLRKLIGLKRRLENESTKSKILKFGSRFVEKSTNEVDRNF